MASGVLDRIKGGRTDLVFDHLSGAAFHGHWRLCEFLVESGADVNAASPDTVASRSTQTGGRWRPMYSGHRIGPRERSNNWG